MSTDAKFTPGPWKAQRTDWRGDPVEHKIYVVGDEQESFDDEGASTGTVATAVAIVEGNATSQQTTDANACLIQAGPALYEACRMVHQVGLTPAAKRQVVSALIMAEEGGDT